MQRIAGSFTWPFAARPSTWLGGALAVLLFPLAFVLVFGYAVAAVRATGPPPRWTLSRRIVTDGIWTALAVAITLVPFAVALMYFSRAVSGIAFVVVFFALALPWGLVALVLLPSATAAFALSGNARDMFDIAASVRSVRRDFATWNVACAAIVTAWAIGLACIALGCVGIVPGMFYAILVSAHATAALARPQPEAPNPDRTAR